MEKKLYAVEYKVTTHYESIVRAISKAKARAKVVEVIGEPVSIGLIRPIKPIKENNHE